MREFSPRTAPPTQKPASKNKPEVDEIISLLKELGISVSSSQSLTLAIETELHMKLTKQNAQEVINKLSTLVTIPSPKSVNLQGLL